ncbi:MAG: hypothetical protein WDN48_03670 [Pseudolabrys sp.]
MALTVGYLVSPAVASDSVEDVFRAFDLFGTWATACNKPATPSNPRVSIKIPSPGLVLEDHDLGPDFTVNRYSVLSATRLSDTRLRATVIFQPAQEGEERQVLEFLVRNETRRTMFNQPEGGPVRVKDGVALTHRVKTPVLKKCE